ncbi:MAG TPA: serine/threonine-protein kinase [Kofleriaceae bacterium]|nr:serine/threonine-protein kinase [Kofleriaceae bacterium]
MAEVERSLERYDVLERIAVGGMAEVFLAKAYGAHGFEKTLAIKRILPELARDPEFEERFIAEAKVAVKLSHANIVQVFDFGRFAGSLFIAMEFIDGLDLAAVLRRGKEHGRMMPIAAAFHIAIEIARGLDFAHAHGVVHRDVSPSNILLSRAGEVKIADFGIAVAARPAPSGRGSNARKVMGKWRYMSPEQARGDEVSTRSDLFSAAAVMFELFTGEKLFPGEEADEIIRNIDTMTLPKASQMRPGLPSRLDDILHSALQRKSEDRPARAALLQRQLTELSYESSIVATALDVAEAVSSVIDLRAPAGRNSLDDMIRRQIAGALGGIPVGDRSTDVGEVSRHTAQATDPDGSGLLQKIDETGRATMLPQVDENGITMLVDETTIAAVPKALGRNTGPNAAITDPSGPISRTPLPHSMPVKQKGSSLTPVPPPRPEHDEGARFERIDAAEATRGRGTWIAIAVAIAAGGVGAGIYLSRRGVEQQQIAPPNAALTADAPVASAGTGTLVVDTVPRGATFAVGDKVIGTTPLGYEAPAGSSVSFTVTMKGYRPVTDTQPAPGAGVRQLIKYSLVPAPASLHVESEPPGASVSLHGRSIGDTPLDLDDLDSLGKVELVLTLTGYERTTTTVDLEAGERAISHVTMKALPKVGMIKINFDRSSDISWGDVYLGSKKIGRAPGEHIKLPVGHQRLRLYNPQFKRSTFLEVDVSDTEEKLFTARF